jgi:GMP synthase-like glutamine amidotransferase
MIVSGLKSTGVDEPRRAVRAKGFSEPEAIAPEIEAMRVLIVDSLHKHLSDVSEVARRSHGFRAGTWLKRERTIAALALENIDQNVKRLVRRPLTRIVHLSEMSTSLIADFDPDAIVLSGTLSDFDFYNPNLFENLKPILQTTRIPVLGICGGHQLIGTFWGAEVVTIDGQYPWEKRDNRLIEYQYRFVKLLRDDPIFEGVGSRRKNRDTTHVSPVIKVWQNHALKLDRVPPGFVNLAKSTLCDIQMLVKRSEGQLIYTVQFHIEKSFEDWNKRSGFWDHRTESRDGRIIFANFLREALKHRGKQDQIIRSHRNQHEDLHD